MTSSPVEPESASGLAVVLMELAVTLVEMALTLVAQILVPGNPAGALHA
ncbi:MULTISPECIES: hypothetical protein [Kocuria]|nr:MULTISPECIES: hypothetical protein [Kocuria]